MTKQNLKKRWIFMEKEGRGSEDEAKG